MGISPRANAARCYQRSLSLIESIVPEHLLSRLSSHVANKDGSRDSREPAAVRISKEERRAGDVSPCSLSVKRRLHRIANSKQRSSAAHRQRRCKSSTRILNERQRTAAEDVHRNMLECLIECLSMLYPEGPAGHWAPLRLSPVKGSLLRPDYNRSTVFPSCFFSDSTQ